MKAQFKCSNCGAEVSKLNLYYNKKQWAGIFLGALICAAMLIGIDKLLEDRNDFRSDLHLSNIEKNYLNGTIEVFGNIENRGKVNWENIVIEAEFFADDGKFFDELTTDTCINLLPGASEHFKISSKGFPQSRWDAIHEMKVKVADAYHSKF